MPRPLAEQVVVVTGASSGIGREAAERFGEKGAAVVLASRDDTALRDVAARIEQRGGRAEVVATDVSDWNQVQRLAQAAVDRFGRIDTWVNAAAVGEYATVEQSTVEEIERIIQVNLLGQIYGMKAALPHLRRQNAGAIINVGSVESEVPLPYHSAYGASKHGIKGFTDVLRLELKHEGSPISVTLIEPASMNTPFFVHTRSKLGVLPYPLPPVYEPHIAADTVVYAAEHPRRRFVVGGSGVVFTLIERIHPSLVDWMLLRDGWGFKSQRSDRPDDGRDNLYAPMPGTDQVLGPFTGKALRTSLYTRYVELSPLGTAFGVALCLLGATLFLRRWLTD